MIRLRTLVMVSCGALLIGGLAAIDPTRVCVGDYSESDFLNITLPVDPWTWNIGASKIRERQITETVLFPATLDQESRPEEGVVLKHYPNACCVRGDGVEFSDAAICDLQDRFPGASIHELRSAPTDRFVYFQDRNQGQSGLLRLTRSRTGWFEIAYVQFRPTSEQVWLAWQEAIGNATLHYREEVALPGNNLRLPSEVAARLPKIAGPCSSDQEILQNAQAEAESEAEPDESPSDAITGDPLYNSGFTPNDVPAQPPLLPEIDGATQKRGELPQTTTLSPERDPSALGAQLIGVLSSIVAQQTTTAQPKRQSDVEKADVDVQEKLESGDYDTTPFPYEDVTETPPDEDETVAPTLSLAQGPSSSTYSEQTQSDQDLDQLLLQEQENLESGDFENSAFPFEGGSEGTSDESSSSDDLDHRLLQEQENVQSGDLESTPFPFEGTNGETSLVESIVEQLFNEDELTAIVLPASEPIVACASPSKKERAIEYAHPQQARYQPCYWAEAPCTYWVQPAPVYCIRPVPPPSQVRCNRRICRQRCYGPTLLDRAWTRYYGRCR